jgi:hypothetical protein
MRDLTPHNTPIVALDLAELSPSNIDKMVFFGYILPLRKLEDRNLNRQGVGAENGLYKGIRRTQWQKRI